ncbi:MAG: hypothetical protein J5680_03420 [Neisseriaceae bacterium]|nr:hypothetical protein [Neisseriaceae bacterium]
MGILAHQTTPIGVVFLSFRLPEKIYSAVTVGKNAHPIIKPRGQQVAHPTPAELDITHFIYHSNGVKCLKYLSITPSRKIILLIYLYKLNRRWVK